MAVVETSPLRFLTSHRSGEVQRGNALNCGDAETEIGIVGKPVGRGEKFGVIGVKVWFSL